MLVVLKIRRKGMVFQNCLMLQRHCGSNCTVVLIWKKVYWKHIFHTVHFSLRFIRTVCIICLNVAHISIRSFQYLYIFNYWFILCMCNSTCCFKYKTLYKYCILFNFVKKMWITLLFFSRYMYTNLFSPEITIVAVFFNTFLEAAK